MGNNARTNAIPQRRAELRRLAIQLAAQLPDDESEALYALEGARHLVSGYLKDGGRCEGCQPGVRVVKLEC